MAYVIAEPCIGTKETACVDSCPVDCIHPTRDSPNFETEPMLYTDPVECIDCGACVPVCPVGAIFALDDLPEKWNDFAWKNARFFEKGHTPNLASSVNEKKPVALTPHAHNVFPTGVSQSSGKPCIFISHRKSDKALAAEVAAYCESIGLLYWFDERDLMIEQRMAAGDSYEKALVHGIEMGLKHSTDILGIITPQVMGSWWVPFEIGAGRALGRRIAHLVLKSVVSVPEYIQVSEVLWTVADLERWAKRFKPKASKSKARRSASLAKIAEWIR